MSEDPAGSAFPPAPQTSGVMTPPPPPTGPTLGDDAGDRRPGRAPLIAAFVAVVVALVTAGVLMTGGPKDERTPTELLAASSGAVEGSGAAKMSLKLDAEMAMMGQKIGLKAEAAGLVSFIGGPSTTRFDMFVDLGAIGGGGAAQKISLEMISAGKHAYVKVPEDRRDQTNGKAWAKTTEAELTDIFNRTGGTIDPQAFVDYLQKLDDVEEVGREDVRGVSTRHFRGSMSLEELVAEVGTDKDAREAARKQFSSQGIERVPVEAWVDDEGRPRKIVTRLQGKAPAPAVASGAGDEAGGGGDEGSGFSLTNVLELYDYGTSESVDIPDDDDVYDADGLEIQNLLMPRE